MAKSTTTKVTILQLTEEEVNALKIILPNSKEERLPIPSPEKIDSVVLANLKSISEAL